MHLTESIADCSLSLSLSAVRGLIFIPCSPHDLRTAWTLISQNDFHFSTFHSPAASCLRPNIMAILHFQVQDPLTQLFEYGKL